MLRFVFLSEDYMREAARVTRECAEYQQASRGFDDTLCFVAEPEPGKGIGERKVAGIFLPAGDQFWVGEDRPVTFTLSAPYGNYVDIMTGALDPVRALTLGKLRLKGPMTKILRYIKGTQLWINALRTVPTQFEGEYAGRSFGEEG